MTDTPASRLRALLAEDRILVMPCCFDALSAKLIEQSGFPLTFMSGFAASASRIGAPDLGLMSYAEVLDHPPIHGAGRVRVLYSGCTPQSHGGCPGPVPVPTGSGPYLAYPSA